MLWDMFYPGKIQKSPGNEVSPCHHSKLAMRGLLGQQEMLGQLGLTAAIHSSESQQSTWSLHVHV